MADEGSGGPQDPLDLRLDELTAYETFTPFDQLYCRLMVAWSRETGGDAAPLRSACERLFEVELWYHQTLSHLGEQDRVSHEDLRSIADKRRINLTALVERVEATETTAARAGVLRHLLLAECHYHLREVPSVVADLQAAIECGGGHPLVHFALGYNWFDYAREILTDSPAADSEQAERRFRAACLRAVQAFRDGLTGQLFDAQLHLWIGRAFAAAGLLDEAEAAIETAARIDPELLAQARTGGEDEEAPGEVEGPPRPISEDEVRRFGDLLRRSWRPQDLLDED